MLELRNGRIKEGVRHHSLHPAPAPGRMLRNATEKKIEKKCNGRIKEGV